MASIDEGDSANIDITLIPPLTQFLKDQASTYRANVVTKDADDQQVASYDILGNVAVGTDSGMFTTNYPQNSYWNGDRTYTVALDSDIPLVVAASGPVVTYTVEDDEKPSVTLERVSGSGPVMEGGDVKLIARLTNAPPSGAPQDLVINLVADAAASTAVSTEYSFDSSVVTIAAGSSSAEFTVMVNTDDLAELDEKLVVKVDSLTYGTTMGEAPATPVNTEVMIRSTNKITATITAPNTDEDGTVSVGISLNLALPSGLNNDDVKLVLGGTDRTADVKSGLPANIATDLTGDRMATVMVPLEDDDILEGTEEVTLMLELSDRLKPHFTNADSTRVTFEINDNEGTAVSISTPAKTEYPEDEDVELTFALPTGVLAGAPITVNYRIEFVDMDGNGNTRAKASTADITGGTVSGMATIPANQNSIVETIDLNDDSDPEETELFKVSLTSVSSDIGATYDVTARIIAILDKGETLKYSFVGSGKVSEENTVYTVRLRRLGELPGSGGGATVPFAVSGGSGRAAVAADFAADAFPTGNFVFTGYAAESAEVTLPAVKDDGDIEGDETLRIALTSRTETHDVTLADNDVPVIDIERVSGSGPVAEGASVQFRARLGNAPMSGATEELTVNLALGLTSAVFAADVSFLVNGVMTSTVTIPMGMTDRTFMVIVKDDELAEFPEDVRIVAQSVDTALLGNNLNSGGGYDLEITSDDMITVTSIEVDDTNEGAGPARVRITLSQPLPENVSSGALMLNLVNGERASDLSGLPDDVTDDLKRSSATQTPAPISTEVMIPLVDDMLLEGTELVSLWLQVVSPDLAALMTGANASFEINDNEGTAVSITAPSKTMYQEGDTFDLTIALPTGVLAGAQITVNYRIEFVDDDGNGNTRAAASAADITGGTVSGSARIPANQNSIPVTIGLNDDSEREETELFKVSLDSVVADIPATRDPTARIISILDDEPLKYSFVGSGTVSEGSTGYTVRLRRLGAITETATVAYTVSDATTGNDVDADDFGGTFPSGNFEFTNYNARAEITLTVADDNDLEGPETFRIASVGETHDVTLVDNESGVIGIDQVSTTSPEDGDMVEFEVSLPDGVTSDAPITVSFEIITPPGVSVEIIDPLGLVTTVSASGLGTGFAQGLALPVRGFAQVARTTYSIMIPAGQTSVRFTIQLTHDGSTEVREQLMVRLLSASSSSASAPLVVVDSNTTGLASIMLSNFDVPAFSGLPATGGPVLPIWLVLLLALTGIALLVPTLRRLS